jgi:hypothetical protein
VAVLEKKFGKNKTPKERMGKIEKEKSKGHWETW